MLLTLIDRLITTVQARIPERYPGVDDDAPAMVADQRERW